MCFNNFSSMNSTRGFWTAPTWAKIICLKKVGGVLETYFHCLLNGFKQNIIKGYFLLLNQGLIHLWLKLLESFLYWNSWTFSNLLEPSYTFLNFLENLIILTSYIFFLSLLELSWTVLNRLEPSWTFLDIFELSWTFMNRLVPDFCERKFCFTEPFRSLPDPSKPCISHQTLT